MKTLQNRGVRKLLSFLIITAVIAGACLSASGTMAEEQNTFSAEYSYLSSLNKEMIRDTCFFSDEWFLEEPEKRNDALGLASAQLTALSNDGEQLKELMIRLGFSDARAVRFDSDEANDCAYVIGTKEINRNGGKVPLVAVVFQGRKYGSKGWMQNVTVNTAEEISNDHGAYAEAAEVFLADLEKMPINGKQVFWISGLSRAGGIANVVSARLLEQEIKPAVYCYTFEAPAVTQEKEAHGERYRCIHNYTCSDDPITRIPFWAMNRYGQDHSYDEIPVEDILRVLNEQNPASRGYFAGIQPDTFHEDLKKTLDVIIGNLELLIPTREAYSQIQTVSFPNGDTFQFTWQESLRLLCRFVFGSERNTAGKISPDLKDILLDTAGEMINERRIRLLAGASDPAAFRMKERWELATGLGHLMNRFSKDYYPAENLYALLTIFDLTVAPDVLLQEADRLPVEGTEEIYYKSVGGENIIDVLASYGSRIVFSHQIDVIIARLKIISGVH